MTESTMPRPAVAPPSSTSTPSSARASGEPPGPPCPARRTPSGHRAPDRADPTALLIAQETTRVPELVPLRHERMLASPFTFYRGAAVIMAADLATSPNTGLRVQACGDAHLSNFGGFAAPDRATRLRHQRLRRDQPRPVRVGRQAPRRELRDRGALASFIDEGDRAASSLRVAKSYREAMAEFAEMTNLEVWYARLDVEKVFNEYRSTSHARRRSSASRRNLAKAQAKDNMKAFAKLTEQVDGEYRIKSDPPVVVAARATCCRRASSTSCEAWLEDRIRVYRRTLQPDRRHLLESYRLVDFARKVVGVGQRRHAVLDRARCSAATTTTRCSSRSRRPRRRCSRPTRAGAGSPTTGNASWRASACSRRRATSCSAGSARRGPRRRRARLLPAPALGREVLGRHRHDVAVGARHLRPAVRVDPGPRPRPLRRPRRHRRVPGNERRVRQGDGRVQRARTPTRTNATTRRWRRAAGDAAPPAARS